MNGWQLLTQLEDRLQNLIEGSAARLFPGRNIHRDFAHRLLHAMQAGLRAEPDGIPLAPSHFIIELHPAQAGWLRENKAFLDELAGDLQRTGIDAGWRFAAPVSVMVIENPQIEAQALAVCAELNRSLSGNTSALRLQSSENRPVNGFLIVNGERVFSLSDAAVNIGRREGNNLVIADRRVSRNHAQLRAIKGRYMIFDLGSTGGTFVNGQRITQSVLHPGDVISLAGVPLIFGQEMLEEPTETQKYSPPVEPVA